MKKLPAWLVYTVLRLLVVVVPLAILLILFGSRYWPIWVIASVIIGFTLSYIFLGRYRQAMAEQLASGRTRTKTTKGDDADEDAEIEASGHRDDAEGGARPSGRRHRSGTGRAQNASAQPTKIAYARAARLVSCSARMSSRAVRAVQVISTAGSTISSTNSASHAIG